MRTTYLWLLQLFTGLLILVLLVIQLISIHLRAILRFFGVDATELTSWGLTANRANRGIWAGLFVVLAGIILFHALSGLRNTVLEVVSSVKKVRIITWLIIASGIILLFGIIYAPRVMLPN